MTRTQIDIETYCYLSFHLISFWSTFFFTLVEAVVLYHATLRTNMNTNTTSTGTRTTIGTSSSTQSSRPVAAPWTLGMICWNMISTFTIALLFTTDPYTYEHLAHILEYTIQMGISMIDLAIVVVIAVVVIVTTPSATATVTSDSNASLPSSIPPVLPLPSSNNNKNNNSDNDDDDSIPIHGIDNPLPKLLQLKLQNKNVCWKLNVNTTPIGTKIDSTIPTFPYSTRLIVFELMIAIGVLTLSILTFIFYTTNVTSVPITTTTTTRTWQHAVVVYMGGPEHAAHTMEFITEILNGLFVFIFTYVSV